MSIAVGDKVTCSAEYDWYGTHLASFVRTTTYDVIQVGGPNLPNERVVIGIGKAVTAAVDVQYLTNISNPETPTPKTEPVEVKVDSIDSGLLADKILSNLDGNKLSAKSTTIDGSKVQYLDERYTATSTSDYSYDINKAAEKKQREQKNSLNTYLIETQDPSIVQNGSNFPKLQEFDSTSGYYRYDYFMDYESDTLLDGRTVNSDMDALRKSLNMDIRSRDALIKNYTQKYDKYKLGNNNDRLAKSFSHVFFVRPDCNIYAEGSSAGRANPTLVNNLEMDPEFYYAKKHCPDVLRQLTQLGSDYDHEFMLLPSNKCRSFEIADEYITESTYGQGLTGYKIPYGKHNVESKTAGEFSISYIDDRDLHMYTLHKLWTEYIAQVYRGKTRPRDSYIINKILDYPTCLYYFLCAEDGETIIFWTKYWGVFPIEAPSSGFSYSAENPGGVKDPELRIKYRYAWKEDFNPLTMIEFNTHSTHNNYNYINHYQPSKLGTGYTWAGVPFVETFNGSTDVPYTFKLRFRPEPTIRR